MFDDDELLEEIAKRYGVSKLDVVRSRQMSAEYDKEHQKRKQQRKLAAQQETKRKEKEKYRREHPDECFCYQDGFGEEANHLYDEGDEIIGYETRYSGITSGRGQTYQSELFKCGRCGRKYGWPIVFS
jgi:hypothetical protein